MQILKIINWMGFALYNSPIYKFKETTNKDEKKEYFRCQNRPLTVKK
jgi:hypothetical protein